MTPWNESDHAVAVSSPVSANKIIQSAILGTQAIFRKIVCLVYIPPPSEKVPQDEREATKAWLYKLDIVGLTREYCDVPS